MKTTADDRFGRYFTEKLWAMIPAIYRHEDGIAERPNVLRALIEVMAEQAALVRRSQDHLWEDQFIELCNEWAVPYIADLVGTRLLSALNKRGRRVDVAKTIYYRRRKGTPRILEELVNDISGWHGKLIEEFQRLGRSRHFIDPKPVGLQGRFTGTMPGGWADIRRPGSAELAGSPFDEYYYTADIRKPQGRNGRYGIPKLSFHLYRLLIQKVEGCTPFSLGDDVRFTVDPSGRDIQLFIQPHRPEKPAQWDDWYSAFEWELPAPLRCRLLAHGEYSITSAVIRLLITNHGLTGEGAGDLTTLKGSLFKDESSLRMVLQSLPNGVQLLDPGIIFPLLKYAIIEDCGKRALLKGINPGDGSIAISLGTPPAIITEEYIVAANLEDWSATANNFKMAIDPGRGRLMFLTTPGDSDQVRVSYCYGFSAELGAGTYMRRHIVDSPSTTEISGGGPLTSGDFVENGVAQINDSKTYGPVADIPHLQNFTLQSANRQRPYIRLQSDWILNAHPDADANLTLDGLWIGCAASHSFQIILQGTYNCVTIRNSTLDPGGGENVLNQPLHSVVLTIDGSIEQLCIENSIIGPVATNNNGLIKKLSVSDSIIQSVNPAVRALTLNAGLVNIQRTTVFGKVAVHSLEASEVICTDVVKITDNQTGCFRFSAAPVSSSLPHPYECFLFASDSNHWFNSRRFGRADYAQLNDTAPVRLVRGSENGCEMGAFSKLLNPVKLDGLRAKIDEYMPFGLISNFINET